MKTRNPGRQIVLAIVCLCILLNGYFLLRRNSFGWNLAKALRNPNEVMHTIAPLDRLYADLAPDTNALLSFRNFGEDNEHLAEVLYYRSCYAAYPHQVFAAQPDRVINSAKELLATSFEPNDEWLDAHRVARVVVYEQQADGNVKALVVSRDLP